MKNVSLFADDHNFSLDQPRDNAHPMWHCDTISAIAIYWPRRVIRKTFPCFPLLFIFAGWWLPHIRLGIRPFRLICFYFCLSVVLTDTKKRWVHCDGANDGINTLWHKKTMKNYKRNALVSCYGAHTMALCVCVCECVPSALAQFAPHNPITAIPSRSKWCVHRFRSLWLHAIVGCRSFQHGWHRNWYYFYERALKLNNYFIFCSCVCVCVKWNGLHLRLGRGKPTLLPRQNENGILLDTENGKI